MQFRVFFLRSRYRIGIFYGVAKISNIFLGCLKFLIFFGVNGRCWVRAYVCGKIRVPPLGHKRAEDAERLKDKWKSQNILEGGKNVPAQSLPTP